MKAHWHYFVYVLRHKWFVFQAGLRLKVPLWQLLIHDLSKFSRTEWGPYVRYFHGGRIMRDPAAKAAFEVAWRHHQAVNPHHWQYWLRTDNGQRIPREMPERYVREMVADWIGAGRASGKRDIHGWYARNKDRKILHATTRQRVEALLRQI